MNSRARPACGASLAVAPRAARPAVLAPAPPEPALHHEEVSRITSAVPLIEADQAPLLARPFYAGTAPPSPITASLAHVPEVLEVTLPFIGRVLDPSSIDERTKEIVIVRVSALLECRYCVQTHTAIALDSGLGRDEVLALRGEAPLDAAFPDAHERALIAWSDAVARGTGAVEPSVGDAFREHFDDPEVVELTLLAGATMMLNRYCSALALPTGEAALARLANEGIE